MGDEFMEIKIKDMERDNWLHWTRCADAYTLVNEPGFTGMAALKQLLAVEKPLVVQYETEQVKVSDNGFYWLQMAPTGGHWWLTVMYDPQGRPVQAYFDVTGENHILPDGGSWFTDLFLDVVVMPDGRAILLDRDELDQALAEGVVTLAQYEAASTQARALLMGVTSSAPAFFAWATRHFLELKQKLR
jgi:predicted RNA-binding protein associated with RNAse of E/G family